MKVMNSKIRVALMALTGVVAGCSHNESSNREDFFRAEDAVSPVSKFADTQAAVGARQDGALYAAHFDGGTLNTLGESKLDSLLRDDEAGLPLTVYVSGGSSDAMTDARWKSVSAYLKDHGLKDSQIKIQDGPNPTASAKSSIGLTDLHKTDTKSAPSAGGGAGASPDASMSGGSSASSGK